MTNNADRTSDDNLADPLRPDETDDAAMREFGRQMAIDGLLRECFQESGQNSPSPGARRRDLRSNWARWSAVAGLVAASIASFVIVPPSLWRAQPKQGAMNETRQDPLDVNVDGWSIRPTQNARFRLASANTVELMTGELAIEAAPENSRSVTVITPNARLVSSGARCLIGAYALNDSKPGDPIVNRYLTRVMVLSGIASLANHAGSIEAQAEQIAQVRGDSIPVVMTVEYNTDFAVDIFRQIATAGDANHFISPYSIGSVLTMLLEGARRETADELGQVLGFPDAARRTGDAAQRIPWETTRRLTGVAKLNEILGQSNTDDSEGAKARSELKRLGNELQSLRERFNSFRRNPPPELAELSKSLESASDRVRTLSRQRRGLTKGTAEYDRLAQEIGAARAERSKLRRAGREAFDNLLAPLERQEKKLVKQFNETLQSIGGYQLSLANALWADVSLPFEQAYINVVSETFKTGGLMTADFRGQPDAERHRINAWVEEQTNQRIRDLLPSGSITTDTGLVVTNAIYFLGEWQSPFDPKHTQPEPFTLLDGTEVPTPMMVKRYMKPVRYAAVNGDGSLFVAPTEYDRNNPPQLYPDAQGFHLVSLPYRGNDVSMTIMVPMRHAGIRDLVERLDSDRLAEWLGGLKRRTSHVAIPRFRVEQTYELRDVLERLGLRTAFVRPSAHGGADFTGIAKPPLERQLFLSRVIHKTFVEVNEQGTEAAAATVSTAPSASAPADLAPFIPEFRADRPFMFVIRHDATGTILFMGRVTKPSTVDDVTFVTPGIRSKDLAKCVLIRGSPRSGVSRVTIPGCARDPQSA